MEFEETTFTVLAIVDAWRSASLQRNAEYQRGETWNLQQKQALVDSLLRGYPIPSLFLHSKIAPGLRGSISEKFEVVDGQQRIIALADYLDDKFDLLDPADKKLKLPMSMRDTSVSWAKRRFSTLSLDDQTRLRDRELRVYVLSEVDHPDQIRDLFIRLQSGTALTRQQIRDAWPGSMGPFVERLAGKLKRHPSVKVFGYVDGRGTRDDDNDASDPYVKQRTTCAQVIHIVLTRITDPIRVPSLSAAHLDALYHERTDFDAEGQSAQLIKDILSDCDQVCEYFEAKRWGRKKLPKVGLFCLTMFFQDIRQNPDIRMSKLSMRKLAEYVSERAPKHPPRGMQSGNMRDYYNQWRSALPEDIGIELDPRRIFSALEKAEIRTRDGSICQICRAEVTEGDDEYDHYPLPHRDGGRTVVENGRLVHSACHPRGRLQYQNPE